MSLSLFLSLSLFRALSLCLSVPTLSVAEDQGCASQPLLNTWVPCPSDPDWAPNPHFLVTQSEHNSHACARCKGRRSSMLIAAQTPSRARKLAKNEHLLSNLPEILWMYLFRTAAATNHFVPTSEAENADRHAQHVGNVFVAEQPEFPEHQDDEARREGHEGKRRVRHRVEQFGRGASQRHLHFRQ